MEKIALKIPGTDGNPIEIGPPTGVDGKPIVPTGGLDDTGTRAILVLIEFIVIVAILLSLYYIVRGGMNIITSGGDKEKLKMGRERIRYAIIGLLVIFFSFALMKILGTLFEINLLFFIK